MKSYIVLATLLGALSAPAFAGDAAVQAAKEMMPMEERSTSSKTASWRRKTVLAARHIRRSVRPWLRRTAGTSPSPAMKLHASTLCFGRGIAADSAALG